MGPALIRIAGPLQKSQAAAIEDLLHAAETGMQAQGDIRPVPADLQHAGRRDRQVRPAAVIKRVGVGNERAQRVVAAAQVQDHEIADTRVLRAREVRQQLGRGKGHRERRDAAFEELPSRDLHTNWYSARAPTRWTRPGIFVCSCVALPVHVVVRIYAESSATTAESSGAVFIASRTNESTESGVFA